MRIRIARPSDMESIRQLARITLNHFGAYDTILDHWSTVNGVMTWVAELGPQLQGFLMGAFMRFRPNERPTVYLIAISVQSQSRRKGVARALMRAFVAWGEEHGSTLGARTFALHIAQKNVAARKFFHAIGFTESPEKEAVIGGEYSEGRSALYLEKPMSGTQLSA